MLTSSIRMHCRQSDKDEKKHLAQTAFFLLHTHSTLSYLCASLCSLSFSVSSSLAGAGYFWNCAEIGEELLQSWDVPGKRRGEKRVKAGEEEELEEEEEA